jgi:glycosyltransferase involved in cell wall biosynthesis
MEEAVADGNADGDLPQASPRELISVVIPTFNRADLVVEAMNSVAAQTWGSVEIIVVDDGSTDQTGCVLEAWKAAHPKCNLRALSQENCGPAVARNAGARAARGAFLYFLDSDDLIIPDALSTLVAPLLAGSAPFSLAHIRNTDLAGRPFAQGGEGVSRQSAESFHASGWMMHAALYRMSTFMAAGPFDHSLRRGEDTEHQWRILAMVGPGTLVDTFIGVRRIHDRGHLCALRTAAEGARDNIAVMSRFLHWAERHGRKTTSVRRNMFLRAAIAAVRACHARDWTCHAEALSLLSRAGGDSSFVPRVAVTILRLRSRLLHAPLIFVFLLLRWLRDWSASRRSGKTVGCAAQTGNGALNVGRLAANLGIPA